MVLQGCIVLFFRYDSYYMLYQYMYIQYLALILNYMYYQIAI
jgi:hypothetical protein